MRSLRNLIVTTHIKQRIDDNKNALILVVGETGSGKSYASIRLSEKMCEMLGLPYFNINEWLEFDVVKVMRLFEKQNQKGQSLVADEIGVSMGAREWQSKANKLMSYAAQTIRYKQHIIFFTVPNLSFIDVHLRKLFHYIIRPVRINKMNKTVRCSIKTLEVGKNINDKQGKLYERWIRYKQGDKLNKIAGHIDLKLPSPDNVKDYELKKQTWSQKLYTNAVAELTPEQKKVNVISKDQRNHAIRLARESGATIEQCSKAFRVHKQTILRAQKQLII